MNMRLRNSVYLRRILAVIVGVMCWVEQSRSGPVGDEGCLKGFRDSVHDGGGALDSWHKSLFSAPCNGSISSLRGVSCNNNRVSTLILTNLGLTGTISSDMAKCMALSMLDLSNNEITGTIPPEIGVLSNLVSLNLSANGLSGSIPVELSKCTFLTILDLHGNHLEGNLPAELGTLTKLQAFDVSYNALSGPIPTVLSYSAGQARFNASSFVGNDNLFGFPLPQINGHGLSVLSIIGIGLASGLVSLLVSFTAVWVWLRLSERKLVAEEGKISE